MKAKDKQYTLPGKQVRLANIRTLLAFFRTAVAFWGLGLALFHFINIAPYKSFGLVSLIFGFVMMIWGAIEFILINRFTDKVELETGPVCPDTSALNVNHGKNEVHEEIIKRQPPDAAKPPK